MVVVVEFDLHKVSENDTLRDRSIQVTEAVVECSSAYDT
jgi:hypothetical protein